MLRRLTVINLAVVEKVEIEFDPGLNVITGETGAGKSVIMGALDIVLGGRAESSLVRDGAKEAEVEAAFEDCTIRRTVTREGRSRAWIDDESVTLAELREFAHSRVDIHGPTANQRLVGESFQRETLDGYGRTDSPFKSYSAAWAEYAALKSERVELLAVGDPDEADLLRFQTGELEAAALTDDDETIGERHAAAAHAEELVEEATSVTEALGGDEGVVDRLAALQPKFRAMARHLPAADEWSREADELTVRAQELSRTVADAVSRLDCGEEDFASLDARLTLVNRLLRKYRAENVAALRALLEEKKAKLDVIENRDARLAELDGRIAESERRLKSAGAALTKSRMSAAVRLGKAVTKELKDLGFLKAKFAVAIEAAAPSEHGCDRIVYMFEPNPGEQARPLADIASSGEIARVMLALKVVLSQGADASAGATMVFDEIDANIGGEIGRVVGEKLRAVASGHQVVAITHLPQSAVYGHRHLVVSKAVTDGRTRTSISPVAGEARVSEIARMLGGEKLTSVVRRHAQELLLLSR